MDGSVVFWLGRALLVFWATGAYNRLVRLRSQGLLAFGLLEGLFRQYIGLVTIHLPIEAGLPASVQDPTSGLAPACEHFKAALKKARNQPLDGLLIEALKQAYAALVSAQRHFDAHAWEAGQSAVERWRMQCDQAQTQIELATADFNRQIEAYNEAISEFPAILLVWLIGFRPARCL